MSADQYVVRFIEEFIVKNDLPINEILNTTPMYKSIVECFESNGWTKTGVTGRPRRFRMQDPNGDYGVTVRGISTTRHPAVTTKICRSKHHTKKLLNLAGVSTPTGAEFQRDESQIASEFFNKMPKPVVVKPTNASSSHGVSVNVSNAEEFQKAWTTAIEESNDNSRVLIEEHVEGMEIRAFVIGNEVIAAAVRLPPFVSGDGVSTLTELIAVEREKRKRNRKVRSLFQIDWDFVEREGITKDTVVPANHIVLLNPFKTTSVGGLFYDITDDLAGGIKELAVAATASIPHLEIAGIDILTQSVSDSSTATVIEINTTPAPDLHRYPAFGKQRPIERQIADFYHADFLNK